MSQRYARIVEGAVVEFRSFDAVPDPNPAKGLDWRPCDPVAMPSAGPGERVVGPTYRVDKDSVTEEWAVEAIPAEELAAAAEAEKELRVDAVDALVFGVLFDLTNEVRGLKGQALLTRPQFRAAVKARL